MNVDDYLYDAIDAFEQAAKGRYEQPEDGDVAWNTGNRVAQLLHEDIESLSLTSREGIWAELRSAFAEHQMDEDIELALQARLASNLIPSFADAAKRCWDLADLLRRAEPPEAAKRFLIRVSRCYLFDFVPECLVMCRGALENGVNARYAVTKRAFPLDSRGVPSMRARLNEAQSEGWISNVSAAALHGEVWLRGSKAAHGDPDAVGNALGAIKLTMTALSDLNPPPVPE